MKRRPRRLEASSRGAFLLLLCLLLLLPGWSRTWAQEGAGSGGPELLKDPLGPVPPDDPRMESYSHGNYILYLVRVLWNAALLVTIVVSGFGTTLLTWTERVVRRPNLKVALYSVLFVLTVALGRLPLAIYAGYLREKSYGFANQTFFAWMTDRGKGLLIGMMLQAVFCVLLYALVRRLGTRWWMAASVLAIVFAVIVIAIAPVFIAPLFNTFSPLKDAGLRAEILEMAHREGIPADEVYEVDASRQSSHINAYVTGLLGTERIVLYDTLLRQFHPREIKVIMGHEMGHYVLHHIWKTLLCLVPVIIGGLFVLDRVSRRILGAGKEGLVRLAEPSSLPVMSLVLAGLLFATGPVSATYSRWQEHQADLFGLEATGDPVAAASAFLKFGRLDLDEYHVNRWIERLTYDHPSLASRVRTAQEYARRHGTPSAAPGGGGP